MWLSGSGATALLAAVLALPLPAQERQHVEVSSSEPRAEDVGSIDGIIKAFYEVISGPPGQPRQWSRDRSLYVSGVRFVAMSLRQGKPHASIMDHQQFVDRSDASLVREGFFEREIHRITQRFGNIAHVLSTYEMLAGDNKTMLGRGVNSIQLFWDGTRWWIAAAEWDDERDDNPIPKELLP